MSLKSCELSWEEEARIEQTRREWRALYTVEMSDVADGTREIYMACPKLQMYQPHAKDKAALVNEFAPKRRAGSNFWDLWMRWSTDVEVALDPTQEPPVIDMDTVEREIPALFDVNGLPIVNVAGDFFTEPLPTRSISDLVIQIEKNIPLNLPDWPFDFLDTTNSDTVRIRGRQFAPGTLYFKRTRIGAEQNVPGAADSISTLVQGTPFTTVNCEMHWRAQGWTIILPNWGYVQLVPTAKQKGSIQVQEVPGKKAKKIRVKGVPAGYARQRILLGPAGDAPSHPCFLDVNGAYIPNPKLSDIVTLQFDLVPSVQYTGKIPLK
jgi:hypothetical protein